MMYDIFVNDIPLKLKIGLFAAEREKVQVLRCNIKIKVLPLGSDLDQIENTINYYSLTEMLQKEAGSTNFILLESLADYLLDKIMIFEQVNYCRITLSKPNIMHSLGAGACGVVMERSKE